MDKISRQTIKLAHIEDVGTGDITTMATVPQGKSEKLSLSPKIMAFCPERKLLRMPID
jgi:nicotinate-nucleotide pyrophosphorylase